jgi:uncharacterized repeat protein (TIGR04076 family)
MPGIVRGLGQEKERMTMGETKLSNEAWKALQERLGYSHEEMENFEKDPRNQHVLSIAPEQMSRTIILEVIESHGCATQHKVGDKFYFDGAGNLITKLCPSKVCYSAISSASNLIFAAVELFYAGVNPNKIQFKRVGCPDVGVACGGWGHIVMELKVEDRKK